MIRLDVPTILVACATAAVVAGLVPSSGDSGSLWSVETLKSGRSVRHSEGLTSFGTRGALVTAR